MIKPDLIITWPSDLDYPYFREMLTAYREFFGKIIIAFEIKQGDSYVDFIKENFKATYVFPREAGRDWRDTCVKAALKESKSNWVWFMEQDFIIFNHHFFKFLQEEMKTSDVIGMKDIVNDKYFRFHPACLLVRRKLLDKVDLDFSVHGVGRDHFAYFTEQLLKLAGIKISYLPPEKGMWKHWAGLTFNYYQARDGKKITFHPDEFWEYNEMARLSAVPKDKKFLDLINKVEQTCKPK